MPTFPKSRQILEANRRFIPGGVVSVDRPVAPEIVFVRGEGPLIGDTDGNEYVDYHAAFAPHFLGHNDPDVTCAVERVLRDGSSLFGTGTSHSRSARRQGGITSSVRKAATTAGTTTFPVM